MADDVAVKFGADIGGLTDGTAKAGAAIKRLQDPINEFGALTARQVGSVASLFDRLGTSVGVSLGPIGILSTELVRASQHFTEFASAGAAFEAIGATLYEAITNPLTIAIGVLAGGAALLIGITNAIEGPSLDDALKRHKQLVEDLVKAYGDAGKAATDYAETSANALKLTNQQIISDLQGIVAKQLGAFSLAAQQGGFDLYDAFGVSQGVPPAVQQFLNDISTGNADVIRFRDTITSIALDSPVGSPIRDLMEFILSHTKAAADAAAALTKELGGAKVLSQLVPKGSAPTFEGFNTVNQPTPGQLSSATSSLRNDLAPKPFTAPGESGVATALKDMQKQSAALMAQVAAFGQTTAAAAGYDAEQKVIAVAAANNVKLTADQQKALQKYGAQITATTANLEHMKAIQDSLNQLAQQIVSAFAEWTNGTATLGQAFIHLAAQIAEAVVEALALDAVTEGLSFLFPGAGLTMPTSGLSGVVGKVLHLPGFAAGSWSIPEDTMAMVHKNEMVVPAQGGMADAMRGMLAGGGIDHDALAGKIATALAPHIRRLGGAVHRQTREMQALGRRV